MRHVMLYHKGESLTKALNNNPRCPRNGFGKFTPVTEYVSVAMGEYRGYKVWSHRLWQYSRAGE